MSVARGELLWISPDAIGLPLLPRLLERRSREEPLEDIEATLQTLPEPPRVYAVGPGKVGTKQLAWEGLQSVVQDLHGIELIGTAADPEEAGRAVGGLRPDVILMATERDSASILAVTEQLQIESPESRLVVVGDRPDQDLELALREMGASYVLWDNLDREAVACAIATALMTELQVVSPPSSTDGGLHPERRRRPRLETQVFTEQERLILHGLARGLTQPEIAEQEGIPERTVHRRVKELKQRFGVKTLPELRRIARELGFGKDDER